MRMFAHPLCRKIYPGLLFLSFLLLAANPSLAQVGRPEGLYYKSWAVVIGIDDYLIAPKLAGAVADAKAVAQALRQQNFEEVVEVYNKDASYRGLHHILDNILPRKVGRHDRIVIFFAGHAGTSQDMRGKEIGYLVPWDAQIGNSAKAVSMDHLKEFSRRVMAKHILFVLDAGISGWDVTPPQQLSLEGRLSPEMETDKRAVQVLTAASKGEIVTRTGKPGLFVQEFLAGMKGAADVDQNGWVMGTELGAYITKKVQEETAGKQHPQFARLDGDGDTILIEGKPDLFRTKPLPKTPEERLAAAKEEYETAFAILQQQGPVEEVIERLNRATELNPSFGDAYVLKSFLFLDFLKDLNQALVAGEQGVKYGPNNPDAHYTLGLVFQRRGQFKEAEEALRQALAVKPNYTDVYLTLGDLYAEDLKDKDKSVEAYRKYIETGGTEYKAQAYLEKAGASPSAPKP